MTIDFLKTFKKNLDAIFNIDNSNTLPTYENTYIYLECTVGWWQSVEKTCNEYDMNDLANYYNHLNWIKSDAFDLELSNLLLTHSILKQK